MRLRLLGISAVTLVILGSPLSRGSAFAQPPTTETFHDEVSETETDEICGESVDIDLDYSIVVHFTTFGDGRAAASGHLQGTFSFELNGVTYTGHFHQNIHENVTNGSANFSDGFNVVGMADRGKAISLRGVSHITLNADGDLTADVELEAETCP